MSWYIENLIRNCDRIRSNITPTPEVYIDDGFMLAGITEENIYFYEDKLPYEIDYEDESFNNLLLLEKTIQELYKDKKISVLEHLIITLYSKDTSMEEMIKSTGLQSRLTIIKIFSKVCDRIGYILGGEFTDAGLEDKLCKDYNLTEEQMIKVRNYLNKDMGAKNI